MLTRATLVLLLLRWQSAESYRLIAGARRRTGAAARWRAADATMLQLSACAPAPLGQGGSMRVATLAPSPPAPVSLRPTAPAVDEAAAAILYQRAKDYEQRRQFGKALAEFEKLSVLTPGDGRVWIKMMTAHSRGRRHAKAERVLKQGIEACPANAKLRQALADFCRKRGRVAEAREHFRLAMELDPQLGSVYDSWGRMEAALGDPQAAASLFRRGLVLRPTARLHHALGVLLDTGGQTEQAREVLQSGLRLPAEENNPQLLHALGMLEARAGRAGRARTLFGEAMERHPSYTATHLSLGRLEESMGRYEAARRAYHQGATAPQPNGKRGAVQLWQAWARMEVKLGRRTSAARLYERGCRLFPEDVQLHLAHARLLTELGSVEQARAIYAAEMARRHPHAYAFQSAAALEARSGDADAARELYAKGAALPATEPHAAAALVRLLHAWAVLEWQNGRAEAARTLFDRAQRTDEEQRTPVALPARPAFLGVGGGGGEERAQRCSWLFQWRARFEADCGNAVLARHYYARAANVAPRDGSVWRMWAELEAQQGLPERAALYARRAQELDTEESLTLAVRPSHPLASHAS